MLSTVRYLRSYLESSGCQVGGSGLDSLHLKKGCLWAPSMASVEATGPVYQWRTGTDQCRSVDLTYEETKRCPVSTEFPVV